MEAPAPPTLTPPKPKREKDPAWLAILRDFAGGLGDAIGRAVLLVLAMFGLVIV